MATTVVNKLPFSFFNFCFLSLTSLSFMIVAVATSRWVTVDYDGQRVYLGLFHYCIEGEGCEKWDDSSIFSDSNYDVAKALCITALVLSFGGACILLHFVNKRDVVLSKNQGWLCFAVCLVGGLFAFGGVCSYNRVIRDDLDDMSSSVGFDLTYRFGYSYFLAWGSGVAAIFSAIFGIGVVSNFFKLHMLHLATTQAMNTCAQPIVSVVGGNAYSNVVNHQTPTYPPTTTPATLQ